MNKFTLNSAWVFAFLFLWISCKSDSSGTEAQAAPVSPDGFFQSATAAPPYPRVDISQLRPLSFREIYQFGVSNQGIFHFPVYDELGNEVSPEDIGRHFQSQRGMIMYADDKGEVKAALIRKLSESELKEILQVARDMRPNVAPSDSNSINNK